MTPRINEVSFSESLLNQLQEKKVSFRMDGEGVVSELTHPALIKCQIDFKHTPQELKFRSQSHGLHLEGFKNLDKCLQKYPQIKVFKGYPWQLSLFLKQSPTEAIIDFQELGCLYLNRNHETGTPSPLEYHHFSLPLWLDYALSAELWGPNGKWSRFHDRLHTLFENNGLLIDQDFPGYYPLKAQAKWLKSYGFLGLETESSFLLILTWDFPLTGLIELEKVLARGP